MFGRSWETGMATIVSRRQTEGIRAALQDSQFGASFVYDYIADIAPDSGAPAFRATFTVHFTGRHRNRPNAGEQAPVRFDQRSGKVQLDHAALDAELRDAKQAARDEFSTTASGAPAESVARAERIKADRAALIERRRAAQTSTESATDPLERLERLAALHDRGVLSDAEFATQKAKILDET